MPIFHGGLTMLGDQATDLQFGNLARLNNLKIIPDSVITAPSTVTDKADNVIAVWRPFRRSNPTDNTVKIIIGKIKKQKLVGIPGTIDMFYSRPKNQYFEKQSDCECKGLSNINILSKGTEPEQPIINFYEVESNFNFDQEPNESPF